LKREEEEEKEEEVCVCVCVCTIGWTGTQKKKSCFFCPCSYGDKKVFSCQGLQLAVSWFWDKGLRDITVFVPLWRKEQPRPEAPITGEVTWLGL